MWFSAKLLEVHVIFQVTAFGKSSITFPLDFRYFLIEDKQQKSRSLCCSLLTELPSGANSNVVRCTTWLISTVSSRAEVRS